MADSDKTSLPEEIEENKDVFSEELEKALHINDFVWVENTKPKIMQERDDQNQNDKKQSGIINSSIATVAPYESFRDSSGDTVLSQIKYSNETKTDGEAVVTSELDKVLLVEQQYWEQHESALKKMSNIKLKYPTSQRKTSKKHKVIDITVTTPRHLSYYQFGTATMDVLERSQRFNHVGQYLNLAGRGLNSVVFYSPNPFQPWFSFPCGIAVKVYKDSSDVRKNSAILKKAQREHDNLICLNTLNKFWTVPEVIHCLVPQVVHRFKNVTIMQFIGFDQKTAPPVKKGFIQKTAPSVNTGFIQKTAPSINTLPLKRSKEVYDILVNQLHVWYKLHVVHGKLSSECICLYRDKPYVLGWSHSVRTEHPQALKKLIRDCHFVTEFFKIRGVPVTSTEELFKSITGVEKLSRTLLDEIYGKNLWPGHHLTNPNRTSDDQCRPHSASRFKA